MTIELLNIDALIPYENNAKKHPQEQIELISKSIKENGFYLPILINKDNVIIAGHGRVLAAEQAGLEKVPCIRNEDLTEEQQRKIRVSDNRFAELATLDREVLMGEFRDLGLEGYDLEMLGFDAGFLEEIDIDEFFEDSNSDNVKKEKLIICPSCDFKIKI